MNQQHETPELFSGGVARALGRDRCKALNEGAAALSLYVDGLPGSSWWAQLVPLEVPSGDLEQARAALMRKMLNYSRRHPDANITYATGRTPDDRLVALATDVLGDAPGSGEDQIRDLMLFDMHTLLSAWFLTALWRSDELLWATVRALQDWSVVSAAATARAMLEGCAAFVVEGKKLSDAWETMKASGPPDWTRAWGLRQDLSDALIQAQYGSRITGLSETGEPAVQRTNVLTLLNKFLKARADSDELSLSYEWLCDAVHPSFGSQTAYVRVRAADPLRSTFQTVIARKAVPERKRAPITEPDVAHAAATAAAVAAHEFVLAAPAFSRLVFDYGLTTGVAFAPLPDYFGHVERRPSRNDPCPCGSGKKYKNCVHAWGASG